MWRRLALAAVIVAATGCANSHPAPRPPSAVLSASQPWQHGAQGEPSVWHDRDGWHMIYSAGWDQAAIGYATAPRPSGPWTDHGKILGLGAGGYAHQAARNSILIDHCRLFVYFTAPLGGPLMVATGPNAMNLHVVGKVLTGRPVVNTSVVRDGKHYRLLFEQNIDSAAHWAVGYADATSPLGPFTVRTFPLRSLRVGDGAVGGPDLHKTPDGFDVLYHAARHGTLPTDIYRATSTDLIHWTRPSLVVAHPGGFFDQAADPSEADRWLFYSVADNTHGKGYTTVTRTP